MVGGLSVSSSTARRLRILWVPLLILAAVPVLLTEAGAFPSHDLVGSAIPDIIYLSHAASGWPMDTFRTRPRS